MPIDIDTSATLKDLMLQVALEFGMARYTSAGPDLPNNVNILALLKRAVNNGYQRFLSANKEWSFTSNHTYTLTLASAGNAAETFKGDPAKYRLPSYISGRPIAGWKYRDTRTSMKGPVDITQDYLARLHQGAPEATGVPTYAAHQRTEVGAGPTGQQIATVVWFFPTPDADYVLDGVFRVSDHQLSILEERHIAGADHDTTMRAAALWEFAKQDVERADAAARYEADYMAALARSMSIDSEAKERFLGIMRDTTRSHPTEYSRHERATQYEGTTLDS